MIQRYLHVVDKFYSNPDAIRMHALKLAYERPEDPELTGIRTVAFRPPGVRKQIENAFRIRINAWEMDGDSANGTFFAALNEGPDAEKIGVHYDEPVTWMTLLIYLTPGAKFEAGTSFWQHIKTGLTAYPSQKDATRLGVPLAELLAVLEADGVHRERWKEIDRVGNVYNRAVAFPAGILHSATSHFGSSPVTGRIYHSFHFSVDWKAFKK